MVRMTYGEAKARADHDTRTVGAAFLEHVKRAPRAPAVIDFRGTMSRIKLAGAALALFPLLDLAPDEQNVGVLLPAGQGGTLANLALALGGRTAVNLNHTTGAAQLERMCRLAGVRTIISSNVYLERIGEPALPGRVLHAEDLVARLRKPSVIRQMLRVLVRPAHALDRSRPGQVAVVIFSSGSTGDPKGAQLTHQQIIANCEAVMAHLDLHPGEEVLVTPLPLFHCFGLIPGMWLCLVEGFLIAAQADPRDGAALGKLTQEAGGTFIISTPTFVRGYMRRIEPEQLRTLRFAVVGAEKCPTELQVAFKEKYGCLLLEGYGATELGPVVAINAEDALRDGSVGRAVPGVEVFTMDPDTREILPPGATGLLVVRSAARMTSYLDRPDLTEQAFVHDGYDTGDIGRVDEDGYIHISGRLARFAKIGGEMVPLDNVEAALQRYLDERHSVAGCVVAVSAVSDRRKGERLIVLHTGLPCPPEEALGALDEFPTLFRPRPADFHHVATIPVLGTGKRDLGAVKIMAEEVAHGAAKATTAGTVVRTIIERVRGHDGHPHDGEHEPSRPEETAR
jgi:acyl-[acyl-carrier-protein]-phospholipid O-acyltransferase / long-chain-fatty-acid--[acyl-carrier-protein] ligase